MAAGICLPNKYIMVDVCCSGYTNYADCINNSKFSINKSSNSKSCKEFENGINKKLPPTNVLAKAGLTLRSISSCFANHLQQ
jgi:hypothetical protein